MQNYPEVKLGLVAVSRDCFPKTLSSNRREAVAAAYRSRGGALYVCPTCVENENDMRQALSELRAADCNALVVYLGNFGPETPETLLAKEFGGPVMFLAAAEETGDDLVQGRGDAYCGLLNASYNLALRDIRAYIPEHPVGDAAQCAENIGGFLPIARAVLGLRDLKIIGFGPRPQDFLACNAPIKSLYTLGVEIEENSELDLFEAFQKHAGDARIAAVAADMARELGEGNTMPEMPEKLAQYELTLLDWIEAHRGSRSYVAVAAKCWPAFQTQFGFVPCYVNSRLTARGIPVSCEVDIYGALSEYLGLCVSESVPMLLDINNTVPADLYAQDIDGRFAYSNDELFMGFHCGNVSVCNLREHRMGYHIIMSRTLPREKTNGTLEGDIKAGAVTLYRLQSTADSRLRAYVAQGEVLPVATRSYGGIGIFGIREMPRFYRHELLEHNFPHHGAVVFGSHGKAIFEVLRCLGVTEIGFNRPRSMLYPTENPFGTPF